ncbi:MAG: hypothetical protein IJ693_00120 [Bacteroidaceae bacterium]|nr:hypothetical protein [Bacteroidaceae bacterium]
MKRTTISLILIIILTTCCTRRGRYDAVLAEIDSLTEVDADSANRQLGRLSPAMSKADEGTRAYYDLLRVKAADKAHVKHTSDSLIMKVTEYFEKHTESGHLPEAYYYVGRVNSDMMNGERAIIYFQKAILEDSAHVTPRLQSRVYAQLGYIYLRNGLLDDAIGMQQLAYYYCKQIGDTLGMRYSSEDIQTITALKNDSTFQQETNKAMMIAIQKLNTQVKNQMLHHENAKLKEENSREKKSLWAVILLSVGIIALVAIFIVLQVRKKKERLAEEAADILLSSQSKRQFFDQDINQLLTTHIYNNKVLKDRDWKTIEKSLLEAFPSFKSRLYSLYNLSETEYRICMLIKLEVSPSNIAKLMALGNSAVSQNRLRMQQKVFNGEGTAKDWDKFILSL